MKQVKLLVILLVLPLIAAIPLISFGQYFSQLYDFDSTADVGVNVFIQPDSGGKYLIFGEAGNFIHGYAGLIRITISEDGGTITGRHFIDTSYNSEYFEGNPGAVKQLTDGGYVVPVTIQTYYSADTVRSAVGIIRVNASLDTIFTKLYTDTAVFFDDLFDCAVLPDGGFLLACERAPNTSVTLPVSLLIRTDSNGNLIWSRTYSYDTTITCSANTVEALGNGNILLGAMSTTLFTVGAKEFYDNQPWFLVLDSLGNILRDTLYGSRYGGGGIYLCGPEWRLLSLWLPGFIFNRLSRLV